MDEGAVEGFAEQVRALESGLSGAAGMAAAFGGELGRVRESLGTTGREASAFSAAVGRGVRTAFEGLVFDGMKLSDALRGLGQSILQATYAAAVRPVQREVGGLIAGGIESLIAGLSPFEKGGAFAQGRVVPFARGGIVSGPVSFPMRGGTRGLMGEAGPEAILPLSRSSDGRLGVRMEGGGRPVSVVMHVSTPDVEGFRRSEGQIAAQLARALARGDRNR